MTFSVSHLAQSGINVLLVLAVVALLPQLTTVGVSKLLQSAWRHLRRPCCSASV